VGTAGCYSIFPHMQFRGAPTVLTRGWCPSPFTDHPLHELLWSVPASESHHIARSFSLFHEVSTDVCMTGRGCKWGPHPLCESTPLRHCGGLDGDNLPQQQVIARLYLLYRLHPAYSTCLRRLDAAVLGPWHIRCHQFTLAPGLPGHDRPQI